MINATATPDLAVGYKLPVLEKYLDVTRARFYSFPAESFHTHDALAAEMGMGTAVPQGFMSYAYLSELCGKFFGDDWVYGGTLDVKFTNMLRTNITLKCEGTITEKVAEGDKVRYTLDLTVKNPSGETVAAGSASGLVSSKVQAVVKEPKWSIRSRIGELVADPAARAVCDKWMPELATSPSLPMIKGMKLKTALAMDPDSNLDEDEIAELDAELKAIPD